MNLTNARERRDRSVLQVLQRISTTRANSRIGLVAHITIGFVLLSARIARRDPHLAVGLQAIILGLAVFSVAEYGFHRWFVHGPVRDANFGVTTPLWDMLLGTRRTSKPMRRSDPDRTGARASAKG